MLSTTLVSINSAGTAAGNRNSDFSTTSSGNNPTTYGPYGQSAQSNLSADGTLLAFASDATDLVGSVSDTNQASDVFVRNTTTGMTSLVSVTPDGSSPGNGPSFDPSISPNGRYVAFISLATNLSDVPGQSARAPQEQAVGALYVRDLQTGTTTLLDQTPSGQASDGWSAGQFVFSPDSQSLAWVDTSDDLTTAKVGSNFPANPVPGESLLPTYVYVRNLAAQSTSLVSVSTDGQASGNMDDNLGVPSDLVFSPDSKSLVFGSSATDLTTNPGSNLPAPGGVVFGPGSTNLFLRNLAAGTTTLLSVATNGQLTAGQSTGAVFSPDGQSVAFISDAANLTANPLDPATPPGEQSPELGTFTTNIFIRDLTTGTTSLVSVTPNGQMSNGLATEPVFSPDGGSIAFSSNAADLTSNPVDSTPAPDNDSPGGSFLGANDNIFLRNLAAGTTTLVSVTPLGKQSNGAVSQFVFSPDGHYLAFISSAGDLTDNAFEATPPAIPGAPSNPFGEGPTANVFVRDFAAGTTTLASATTGGLLSNGSATGPIFSPDSGSLFYQSTAIDLTSNPPDASADSGSAGATGFSPGFDGDNYFVYDLAAKTTSLISATTDGQLSNSTTDSAVLSPNGNTLYFDSNVDDLTTNDSNQLTGIFAATAPFTVPNQFQFASWESSAQESDGKTVITVLRSGPATGAASVDYSVQNGSARAGTDFTATSGTLDFAAGQTSRTFSIPLKSGDHFAGTLSANVVLSNPQGGTLGYPTTVLNLTSEPAPSSPTPTPTPTPPPVIPVHPVTLQPGPTVVSVTPTKGRQGIKTLVITFDQPLDPTSAINSANYQVSVPGRALAGRHGHQTAARPARSLAISRVAYNPAKNQVTVTLHTKLHQREAIELQIKGTAGGLADAGGTSLNSPDKLKPGKDFIAALEVVARRS